jgi:hypothetical protein
MSDLPEEKGPSVQLVCLLRQRRHGDEDCYLHLMDPSHGMKAACAMLDAIKRVRKQASPSKRRRETFHQLTLTSGQSTRQRQAEQASVC